VRNRHEPLPARVRARRRDRRTSRLLIGALPGAAFAQSSSGLTSADALAITRQRKRAVARRRCERVACRGGSRRTSRAVLATVTVSGAYAHLNDRLFVNPRKSRNGDCAPERSCQGDSLRAVDRLAAGAFSRKSGRGGGPDGGRPGTPRHAAGHHDRARRPLLQAAARGGRARGAASGPRDSRSALEDATVSGQQDRSLETEELRAEVAHAEAVATTRRLGRDVDLAARRCAPRWGWTTTSSHDAAGAGRQPRGSRSVLARRRQR